jgi:hypothetical protein
MNTRPLVELAEAWEAEAEGLRHRGLEREASMAESFADDLRARLAAWAAEPLSVAEAAGESGYSESRLRQLLAEGQVPNAGREGAPRILRRDLPARPGQDGPTLELAGGERSVADEALARRRRS